MVLLPKDSDLSQLGVKSKDLHFITAGSKGLTLKILLHIELLNIWLQTFILPVGILRVWDASTGRCVYTQKAPSTLSSATEEAEEQDDSPFSLTHLFYLPTSHRVATVTAEHNILLYQLPGLTTQQQVGVYEGNLCFRQTAEFPPFVSTVFAGSPGLKIKQK